MVQMKVDLLVFRAGTATTIRVTAALATSVTGGVLQRTIQTMLGPATWTETMALHAETTKVRGMACLLGALGINSTPLSLTMVLTIFIKSSSIELVEMCRRMTILKRI